MNTDDRRVRLVELTPKGRALITKIFRDHAAAMEEAARVLSKEERRMLLRLLKKLGKGLTVSQAPALGVTARACCYGGPAPLLDDHESQLVAPAKFFAGMRWSRGKIATGISA
jgi:hypothetical protein